MISAIRHEHASDTEMVVHLQGQSIVELQGAGAQREAMNYARKQGFPAGGVDPVSEHPYPVDADGKMVTDPINQKTAGYIRTIRVKRG